MRLYKNNQKGGVIVIAILLTFIASAAAVAIVSYTHGLHKLNERAVAHEKAGMAAEAGIFQLSHYFIAGKSADIPANCAANRSAVEAFIADKGKNPSVITAGGGQTYINAPNLNAELIKFSESQLDAKNARTLKNQPVSRVTSLQILPPVTNQTELNNYLNLYPDDPTALSPPGTMFRFRSTGEAYTTTNDTVERTVVVDAMYNAPSEGTGEIPAALITGGSVASNGHFNLHWGEAWSKQNIRLKMSGVKWKNGIWEAKGDNNQINRGTPGEEWVQYKSAQGYICDKDGNPIMNDPNVYAPGEYNKAPYPYDDALFQKVDAHTPAGEPTLSERIDDVLAFFNAVGDAQRGYNYWKNLAINHATYFRVNANGTISNASGQQIYPNISAAMEYYRGLNNAVVAFFDTTDGQPPVTNGSKSNWIPGGAKFSGKIEACTRGVLYFCGDLDTTGLPAPTISIKNPREVEQDLPATTSARVFHSGVVYTAGDYNYGANGVIYGAAVVNGSYLGQGNPSVYYNPKLNDGTVEDTTLPIRSLRTQL